MAETVSRCRASYGCSQTPRTALTCCREGWVIQGTSLAHSATSGEQQLSQDKETGIGWYEGLEGGRDRYLGHITFQPMPDCICNSGPIRITPQENS